MIDKLTATQEALLKEYRGKVFGYATSTVTDKPKAEAAVRRLTEGAMVEIHWACSPEEARELFCSLRDSMRGSEWYSLRDSLLGSWLDSLRTKWEALPDSQRSLWDSLSDSLPDSLWDSLRGSLWDSLQGSGFVAYHCFSEIAGMAKHEEVVSMRLRCYEELNESCFAMYPLSGHIILLEKPKLVKVDGGKLIEIEW